MRQIRADAWSAGIGKSVAHAAPNAAPWAVNRAVDLYLSAVANDWGATAFLARLATDLTEAANGNGNGGGRGRRTR
jgi:hypothetical protein